MEVHLHFTAQLRTALNRNTQTVHVAPNANLMDVLHQLAQEHPEVFQRYVLRDDGELQPNIIPCVDDAQITDPHNCQLTPGATVTLLSAISGG
jgi:molybdopterin converting factor small subunit